MHAAAWQREWPGAECLSAAGVASRGGVGAVYLRRGEPRCALGMACARVTARGGLASLLMGMLFLSLALTLPHIIIVVVFIFASMIFLVPFLFSLA